MTEERQPKGISRRTVAKGAAWAIPAIPLVVAAPAYAASPGCITLGSLSCKWPGQSNTGTPWGYELELCNNCGLPITITEVRKDNGDLYTDTTLNTIFEPETYAPANTIAPGECWKIPITLYSSNSANFLEVDYTYQGQSTTFTVDKIPSPPDCPVTPE